MTLQFETAIRDIGLTKVHLLYINFLVVRNLGGPWFSFPIYIIGSKEIRLRGKNCLWAIVLYREFF